MPTVLRAAVAAAVTAVLLAAITTAPARAHGPFAGCTSVVFTADGDFICHRVPPVLSTLRYR